MINPIQLTQSLGISLKEAEVYLAALRLGETHMQNLSKYSGINRSTIYTFIDSLKEKGLIIETKKKKRKMYSAVNPRQLAEIGKRRLSELEDLVPELSSISNDSRNKPRVTFYDGIDGVKNVYADMLTASNEILAYEDLESLKTNLPESFFQYFPKERTRRKIGYRAISRNSDITKKFIQDDTSLARKTKIIDIEPLDVDIVFYDNKTTMISLDSKTPFGVIIEDANITRTLTKTWEELWKRLD